jgi:hypothetical protein
MPQLTPDQFKQFMLMQQQMNAQKQSPTNNPASFQPQNAPKTNNGQYPDPELPFEYDEYGNPHYTKPIPGLDDESPQLYSDYEPHLPYFHYTDVTTNKHGGRTVYINAYKGSGKGPLIQLCHPDEVPLRAPFGAQIGGSSDPNKKNDPNKRQSDPYRPNLDLTIENEALLNFLRKWDEKNINTALARIDRWFLQDTDPATAKGLYKRMVVSPPKQKPGEPKKDFKPTVRTKLVLPGGSGMPTRVFMPAKTSDTGKTKFIEVHPKDITLDLFQKGTRCIPVVRATGVWFMGKEYGISLQCTQVLILPRENKTYGNFCGFGEVEIVPPRESQPVTYTQQPEYQQQMADTEMYDDDNDEDPSMYINNSVPDDGGQSPL